MLSSMTGFSRNADSIDDLDWICEARSVNSKGLDLRINLPSGFESLDPDIRTLIKGFFRRGSITVSLSVKSLRAESDIRVDNRLLSRLIRHDRKWAVTHPGASAPSLASFINVRGVVAAERQDRIELAEDEKSELLQGISNGLEALKSARLAEGNSIQSLLIDIVEAMRSEVDLAKSTAYAQPELIRDRLKTRIGEVMQDTEISQERLEGEIALLAQKADVREEIDRLDAHLGSAGELLKSGEPVGRKLEFLSQEFLREANTMGSKSTSLDMTRHSLALKSLIDQFREQAANVE